MPHAASGTSRNQLMRYRLSRRGSYRLLAYALATILPNEAFAQTTYSNTGVGRPLETEDARPLDRFAVEAYVASATFRQSAGASSWSAVPGVAVGLAPRTQLDLTVPLTLPTSGRGGVAGAGLSVLYAVNVETRGLPAFAIRGSLVMPVGSAGPRRAHESVKGIVSRSFAWGRLHFNHQYTFGTEDALAGEVTKMSRWRSALAADRTFALQGVVIGAEAAARRPLVGSDDASWEVRGAARYQLTRSALLEAAVGRDLGDDDAWSVSVGAGITRAHFSMLPGLGRWSR